MKFKVKKVRETLGWNQEMLAKKSGLTAATISRLESGHIEAPRISAMYKIARAFGMKIDDLIIGG